MGADEPTRVIIRIVGGWKYRFRIGDNYKARAAFQREACGMGDHWHNPVEDECCPCFGCCVPDLARRGVGEDVPDAD